MDATALGDFYNSEMGRRTQRIVLGRLRPLWPNLKGLRLLGYGFAAPYLEPYLAEAERCIAAMPAEMGPAEIGRAVHAPSGKCLSVLAEEDALPFPDAFFDRVLVVHGLEEAQSLRPLLRQLWRVLAPEGKLLVVAPNRTGLWAHLEATPFGHGQPYSRGQIERLLTASLFRVERRDSALYMPPTRRRLLLRGAGMWEDAGRALVPRLAGLLRGQ